MQRAETYPRSIENEQTIRNWLKRSHKRRNEGKYAYSFTRTVMNVPPLVRRYYHQFFDDTIEFLQSPGIKNFLYNITGKRYLLNTLFVSRYASGDL